MAFVLSTTGRGRASGTAFVVHADGLLVTALHVVEEAQEVSVTFPGGPTVAADVVGADGESDLAVLRVPRAGLQALRLADPQMVRVGEEVLVVGYPLAGILGAYDVTVTRGIVSAIRINLGLIQVDAAMNPGVSGRPVLNVRGEVVGVATLRLRTGQQVNFAVPTTFVSRIVQRLASSSVPDLQPLRIPLVAPVELSVSLRRGFPANNSGQELGVQCSSPPAGSRAITEVRGNLSAGDVLVVVWLSLSRGVEANHPAAFGHLGFDGAWIPPRITPRTRISAAGLELSPEPVCMNFSYQTELICFACRFEVLYVIQYRVLSIPPF